MKTIETIAEYHSRIKGLNMKFQNKNGSLKKEGFVVLDRNVTQHFNKKSDAEKAFKEGLDQSISENHSIGVDQFLNG